MIPASQLLFRSVRGMGSFYRKLQVPANRHCVQRPTWGSNFPRKSVKLTGHNFKKKVPKLSDDHEGAWVVGHGPVRANSHSTKTVSHFVPHHAQKWWQMILDGVSGKSSISKRQKNSIWNSVTHFENPLAATVNPPWWVAGSIPASGANFPPYFLPPGRALLLCFMRRPRDHCMSGRPQI
jgi:hypothetical protein